MKRINLFFTFLILVLLAYSQQKNVLFIAVDDLKPLLGAYGDKTAITPNFDRLAEMGTTFTNAHCQQAVCGPSRASLLTGVYPDLTEVWDLKTQIRDKNPNILTLPQHYINEGYETVGMGKIYDPRSVDDGLDQVSWSQPYIMPKVFEEQGVVLGSYASDENKQQYFKLVKEAEERGLTGVKEGKFLRENFKPSTESADVPDDKYFDGQVALVAIEQLKKLSKGDKPFFLAVGFKKPHLPFVAPKKYWDLYDRSKLELAEFQKRAKGTTELPYHNFGELRSYTDIPEFIDSRDYVKEEKQRELIHGYYACISYIDAQLGKILDELEAQDLKKNTSIVLWGDHGWHLGDHALWAKHSNFEQATRAPLIFVDPSMKQGQLNDSPVNFVDIFPTLCDLSGISIPDHLQGKSLKPILSGNEKSINDFAISQYGRGTTEGYALRNDRYRYVAWFNNGDTSPGATILAKELYDYKKDPLETENLIGSQKDLGDELHAQLMEFLAQVDADKKAFKADMKSVKKPKAQKPKAGPVATGDQENLLKNPGFEEGGKGWITFGDVEAQFIEGQAHSGNRSALLPQTRIGIMQKVDLKPNTEYVFSAWLKSSNGEKIILNVKDHGNEDMKEIFDGSEYTLVSVSFTTGTNPVDTKVRLMKFNAENSSDAWADDFSLTEKKKTDGLGLKSYLQNGFDTEKVYLGATIAYKQLGTKAEDLITSNFTYTVPENAAKQSRVHPKPKEWDWEPIDAIIKMAEQKNLTVRLHGPISPQASDWAQEDNRKPAELEQIMTEFMTEQCKRFNGHPNIKWMDVVNETVEPNGSWFGPKPGTDKWENPWTIIGSDNDPNKTPIYISKAFEIANKYAPDISLVYNQHGGMEPVMWERVKETILYLRAKGLRVNGIGWQAHLSSDDDLAFDQNRLDYFASLVDWAHANELDFHVTEIDYKIRAAKTPEALQKQADAYANILKVLLSKKSSGVVTYNTWGIVDGVGKHADKLMFIFDEGSAPKPAFFAIQKTLGNPDEELVILKARPIVFEEFQQESFEMNWKSFGEGTASIDPSNGLNGSSCVSMPNDKTGIRYQIKDLEPATKYQVEVWINATPDLKLAFKIKDNGQAEEAVTRMKGKGEFEKGILEFSTGPNSQEAELIINRWETGMEGYVYIDNAAVFKLPNN